MYVASAAEKGNGLSKPSLTSLTHGGGCACKLSAAELRDTLAPVLSHRAFSDPRLIVDASSSDDAGVWELGSDHALVQTVDFFTPVVNDPYDWGRIAAANALSDIYAMGAKPLTALQLVGWPRSSLQDGMLKATLTGGADIMAEADCVIVGGHSIDSPEPLYGFAITGMAHPGQIVTNAGAQPGDTLVLTKPLGTGIATTAIKRGLASPELVDQAVRVMTNLNRAASEAMVATRAHAATDVTGFGLLGHLHEMLTVSGIAAQLDIKSIPLLPGVLELAKADVFPAGSSRNLAAAVQYTDFGGAPREWRRVLADAQTSGGLLIAAPSEHFKSPDAVRGSGAVWAAIGRVTAGEPNVTVRHAAVGS